MNYSNLLYALSFVVCGCYSMLPATDTIGAELTVIKNGPLIDRVIRKRYSYPLSGVQPYFEYNYFQANRSQSTETLDKEKFAFKYNY